MVGKRGGSWGFVGTWARIDGRMNEETGHVMSCHDDNKMTMELGEYLPYLGYGGVIRVQSADGIRGIRGIRESSRSGPLDL